MSRDNEPSGATLTIVDGHAHFYPDLIRAPDWLTAAHDNLLSAAGESNDGRSVDSVLLVADREHQDTEAALRADEDLAGSEWSLEASAERGWIRAHRGGDNVLHIVLGRQITSREGLEVLSFGTAARSWQLKPFLEIVPALLANGGITIVPWGFGKWLGRRGALVRKVIESNRSPRLFVGDSGARPAGTPVPRLISRAQSAGVPNIPGSDPLPLVGQAAKAGSRGSIFLGGAQDDTVEGLRRLFRRPGVAVRTFGKGTPWGEFVASQTQMLLSKRRASGGR